MERGHLRATDASDPADRKRPDPKTGAAVGFRPAGEAHRRWTGEQTRPQGRPRTGRQPARPRERTGPKTQAVF